MTTLGGRRPARSGEPPAKRQQLVEAMVHVTLPIRTHVQPFVLTPTPGDFFEAIGNILEVNGFRNHILFFLHGVE